MHPDLFPAAPPSTAGPFGEPCPVVLADGEFTSAADAGIRVSAHALSYGTGTFDGIRAFWNPGHEDLYLLEAHAHYDRMHQSARILGLPLPYSTEHLVELTADLLRRNQVTTDAYVRPLLFQCGDVLPVRMHDIPTRFTIAVTPSRSDYANPQGVRCKVSSWRRTPDVTMPIRAKVTGSYAGPALAKTEAARAGFDDALMLTLDGYVSEATTANILVRHGSTWATPPVTDDILPGITRRQIMELLAEQTGRTVHERHIHRSELFTSDEILLCGTATIVTPVIDIDGWPVGTRIPGETTSCLRATITAIARRTSPHHPEWTTPVYSRSIRP